MLENLWKLVQEQGQDSVINNPEVPNEQNNQVLAAATHSVAGGLQETLSGGGLQQVMALFNQSDKTSGGGDISSLLNNPIVSNIVSNFTGKLTQDHGVAPESANNIAGSLIPNVLQKLISKTNDPSDSSFDLNGIIGTLTGGGGLDVQGLLGKFSGGLDADGDGKVEVSDIVSKVTGGSGQQGAGMMDMIKGFMQ